MSVCAEEARKSKHLERQTQGDAPGDGASASLPETAKARQRSNATLQDTNETRCLGGKAPNASPGRRSVIGFVFICTDQKQQKTTKKRRRADGIFVRGAVLRALFHVPTLGGSRGAQRGEV